MLNKNQETSIAKRIDSRLKAKVYQYLNESAFMEGLTLFEIEDDGVYYLSKVINKDRIKLNLNFHNVTMIGIGYLQMAGLQYLRCINLGNNPIRNVGVKLLTRCRWVHLQELEINSCQFDGTALTHLSKGKWPNLRLIQLSRNQVGSGVDRLIRGNWKKISQLYLCFLKSYDNLSEANFKIEEAMKITLSLWKSLKNLKMLLKDFKMDYSAQSHRIAIYMKFCEIEKIKNVMTAAFTKLKQISIKHG